MRKVSENFYDVVPASVRHIRPLAADLRPAACLSLLSSGCDPRKALHHAFVSSSYSRTAIKDGTPVAMWGASGTALSDHGVIWLALTEKASRWPLAIVRCARRELAMMKDRCGVLYATIFCDDERAAIFAKTIGFQHCSSHDADLVVPEGFDLMAMGEAD